MGKGKCIWLRVLSIIIWIWCGWTFINVFAEKQEDFEDWYGMYDNYGSVSPVPQFIFYGVIIAVIIASVIGIIAAIKQEKKLDIMAMVGGIAIIVAFFLMDQKVQSMENHFMDTANSYLLYCAMAIYVANIEKQLYLYLGLSVVFTKLKQKLEESKEKEGQEG